MAARTGSFSSVGAPAGVADFAWPPRFRADGCFFRAEVRFAPVDRFEPAFFCTGFRAAIFPPGPP
jgi:hypothetical protein